MAEDIVLALGGGGVRGIAHLGAIECLLENDYNLVGIAGTSAGGLFGAPIAAGVAPREILDVVTDFMKSPDFKRESSDTASIAGTAGVETALAPFLEGKTFEDLSIKLCVTAVSLKSGEKVVLNKGDIMEAVLATIAIPGVFPPQGEDVLVDGGVLDPVPIEAARALEPSLPIVAVTLHKKSADYSPEELNFSTGDQFSEAIIERLINTRLGEALKYFNTGISMSSDRLAELNIEVGQPDVVVRPLVGQYFALQMVDPLKLFDEGYRAMESQLPALADSLTLINKIKRIAKYSAFKSD